ncbi:signal recognition particle receptor subunit alpha-like [Bolinopsis microptera]|uniref:signal recognition particle receptor subunit alpha-like n=1 Tax=Bolinopsis microptera TaxID=2820187 RepID=UPI00307939D7
MLELFSIFTKGGIVLFCFQGACTQLISSTHAVNESIKNILIQGSPSNQHNHKNLTIQLKLDNEFELVFAVVVQKMLQLSYLDKLIDSIHLEFRDKYKNELRDGTLWLNGCNFDSDFSGILSKIEGEHRVEKSAPRAMKQFTQSKKFEKTATANKAMFEQVCRI